MLMSLDNESKVMITQTFSLVKEKIITVDYPQVEDMNKNCLRRRMRNAIIEKVRNIRSLFTVCFRPAEN
ncbi:hypothetical protein EB796_008585 [Bugula neritina]|uniref:Uncharacterized protein n=1 Tax=Bugula neritina TaxID=10212 RepID=A0A7J7K4L2_BUGNE|nr:hypothetical protein EB796_008585 [Bugula neritina]